MKKMFFLATILWLGATGAFAQYQSLFGTVQTSWNVLNEYNLMYKTDSLVAGPDTVIDAATYKKILFYHLQHANSLPPVYETTAFVREDLATGKAWIRYDVTSPEQLFMDLSLNLNDLFNVSNLNYLVDSVYFKDGRKHVRVQYTYPMLLSDYPVEVGLLTFIEGIGPSLGFTYNYQNSGQGGYPSNHELPFLLCGWKDNNHVYTHETQNPFFDGCYKEDTIVGMPHQTFAGNERVTLLPNPASGVVTITTAGNHSITGIEIFTPSGTLIHAVSGLCSGSYILNVSNFPNGIYVCYVRFSDNIKSVRKLIVSH